MRIKELSLSGYKSFASRTRFVFPTGVTAVIGPNGSGKSNIADAVRWVLGETRPSHLRARSHDDLIFAGTERRSRAGIAEVLLTIDNTDGGLPIDFAEVTIGRRAERDGTMVYSINGARVRLRDVVDLLSGRFGQGHFTVIGQGLVDSFIAMRPDQRRALIDDAAGLTPLQRQAERTLRKLADTAENLRRVKDVQSELGPRLRRMERLAERAEQHGGVAAELRALLAGWYGWHTAAAAAAHATAAGHAAALAAERDAARGKAQEASQALDSASSASDQTEEGLRARRAARDAAGGALAAARQRVAVAAAQAAAVERQIEALATTTADLEEEAAALNGRAAEMDARLTELRAVYERHSAALGEARRAQEAADAERNARAAAADQRRAAFAALQTEIARLSARHSSIEETRTARTTQLAEAKAAGESAERSLAALTAAHEAALTAFTAIDEAHGALLAQAGAAESALDAEHAALADAREHHAAARQVHAEAEARMRTLESLFREAGTDAAAIDALTAGDRVAVRGTVAEFIAAPDEWEAAAAAALGPFVRAVVVADARAVADAVDIVRDARSAVHLAPSTAVTAHGVEWTPAKGETRATDVLACPEAPGLLAVLVADVAFVRDLAAATRAVERPGGPHRAATRDGQLVLRGGAVTVGAGNRDVLALARERRALPELLAATAVDAQTAGGAVDRHLEARRTLETELGRLAAARAAIEPERDAAAKARDHALAELDRGAREHAWSLERRARLTAEYDRLTAERQEVDDALAAAQPSLQQLEAEASAAAAALATIDLATPRAALAAANTAQAEAAAALAGHRAALDAVQREGAAARQRTAEAQTRRTTLTAEAVRWTEEHARAAADVERHGAEHAALDLALTSAEGAAGDVRAQARAQAESLEASRRTVAAVDARIAEATVAVARAEDRVTRLEEQRLADAEVLDLASDDLIADADGLEAPDDATETRIGQLRRRLREIGAIDREALATYHETAEHHAHLTAQVADLEAADRDLRTALETLDAEMAAGFAATFGRVAEAFGRYFPQLFGGGEAELTLESTDDAPPGIDIMARPPGKRSQPLSLLSGGERAITAVALLFALLEVSGTPFVVLDEVDAALDEANVDRFRGCLAELAGSMQVVIVTHNRGTVQSAETVYGITMAEDGASQVISLKVDPVA
ncbi:MAG: chromosome segregation protein SMC [Ardenticatenales bacterium]